MGHLFVKNVSNFAWGELLGSQVAVSAKTETSRSQLSRHFSQLERKMIFHRFQLEMARKKAER